jgi:hypothetical protein
LRAMNGRLARFSVRSVLPTPSAVLGKLDPVRRVSLGFVGLVVAALALCAGEGHIYSNTGLSHRGGTPSSTGKYGRDERADQAGYTR